MPNLMKKMLLIALCFMVQNVFAANEGGSQNESTWPLPKFHFSVDFGNGMENAIFQEVSGFDIEAQPIAYRAGNSKIFSKIKMPGVTKMNDVTLKKGTLTNTNQIVDWIFKVKMNTVEQTTVTIKLIDETGAATMTWTLENAFPTKITTTDIESSGNEVAIEAIVISHEGLTIANN